MKHEQLIDGTQSLKIYRDSAYAKTISTPLRISQKSIGYESNLMDDKVTEETESIIAECIYFDHILMGRGFLNKQNTDSWKFGIKGYTHLDSQELIIISAKYLGENNVKHTGTLYINPKDYGIHQIEYHYEWFNAKIKGTKTDSIYTKQSKWFGFASYSRNQDGYTLSNLGYSIKREIYRKPQPINYEQIYTQQVISEFQTSISQD